MIHGKEVVEVEDFEAWEQAWEQRDETMTRLADLVMRVSDVCSKLRILTVAVESAKDVYEITGLPEMLRDFETDMTDIREVMSGSLAEIGRGRCDA